ncbi:hypothetical protein GE09DRAFT_626817 [Coniochaeta sp. 2T2.1]|nr:hypothetical protein GE09DRAFT_626817 [Coniochaeta sp. 2T2.1]
MCIMVTFSALTSLSPCWLNIGSRPLRPAPYRPVYALPYHNKHRSGRVAHSSKSPLFSRTRNCIYTNPFSSGTPTDLELLPLTSPSPDTSPCITNPFHFTLPPTLQLVH